MQKRQIIFFVYEGFELLDMSGPASVFSTANTLQDNQLYDIRVASPTGGNITSSSGVSVGTIHYQGFSPQPNQTLLVAGATELPLQKVSQDREVGFWLTFMTRGVERFGSICTGAFVLANLGVVDKRKITTHWAGCKSLTEAYPGAEVEPHALYVNDGRLWTSAGVTTGIDMALEMVRRDHGEKLKGKIARALVVYSHRPGNQSQFSSALAAQTVLDGAFANLVPWIENNLDSPIKVSAMAERVNMSERSFHRKFTQGVGKTPSKFVEEIKLNHAKEMIENNHPVKVVAGATGFRSEAAFRTAFKTHFGVTPSVHQKLHGRPTEPI